MFVYRFIFWVIWLMMEAERAWRKALGERTKGTLWIDEDVG